MSFVRFAQFSFQAATGDLVSGDGTTRLRPKTANLLAFFLARPGAVIARDELLEGVWPDRIVSHNTLMQSIRELRAALSDNATTPAFIETLHGRGYRWLGPEPVASAAPSTPELKAGFDGIAAVLASVQSRIKTIAIIALALTLVVTAGLFISARLFSPAGSVQLDIARAQTARLAGQSQLARQYFQAALIRDPQDMTARTGLATVLYDIGEWDLALQTARDSLEIAVLADAPAQLAEMRIVIALISRARGDIAEAQIQFAAVRAGAGLASFDPLLRAAALSGLSAVFADQGRIADYLDVRAEAIDPLFMAMQLESYAEGMLSAGTTVHPTFDGAWSLERLERALEVFEELDDLRGIARSHAALGANNALAHPVRTAHLEQALDYYRSYRHLPGELNILGLMASLQTASLNGDAALTLLQRNAEIIEFLGAGRELAALDYARGLALMAAATRQSGPAQLTSIERAGAAFDASITRYGEFDIVFDSIAPAFHRAIALYEGGQAELAVTAFADVAARYQALPFPIGVMGAHLGRAMALNASGQPGEAAQMLDALVLSMPEAQILIDQARADMTSPRDRPGFLFELVIAAENIMSGTG